MVPHNLSLIYKKSLSDINNFLNKIDKNKRIILSIDLDNTLVNRHKGPNYVYKPVLDVLRKIVNDKKFIFTINTGRDIIAFKSFCRDVVETKNAIIGSGSVVISDNKLYFNEHSRIDKQVIDFLLDTIVKGIFPFIDLYYPEGRVLFYNKDGLKYKDLFYGQNPKEWFNNKLPPAYDINSVEKYLPKDIFRIEVPVLDNQKDLYERLIGKKEAIDLFVNLVNGKNIISDRYSVKKKAFFVEKYKGKLTFARFRVRASLINKGEGMSIWFSKQKKQASDFTIIHIEDIESGIVNDVAMKECIPGALIVLLGDKCLLGNPNIDLCLVGEVDNELQLILESIYKYFKI